MSVIPLEADIHQCGSHVRLVPAAPRVRGSSTPWTAHLLSQSVYWNRIRESLYFECCTYRRFWGDAAPLASGREGSDLTSEEIE